MRVDAVAFKNHMLTSRPTRITRLAPCMEGCMQVWKASLQERPSAAELDQLASSELAKAQRFVYEVHARRYLAARVALRAILAMETGLAPRDIVMSYGPFGKPRIDARFGIHFNLSHCEDVALVVVSRNGEVGIDIECPREFAYALEMARVHFSPREREEFSRVPKGDMNNAFLRGWTRKEACLKATGSGLALSSSALETGLCAGRWIVSFAALRLQHVVEVQSFVGPDREIYSVAALL
jgi:4'-phosphopantetheinyl transferase